MNKGDFDKLPENSILGINYSGAHDSAIALVSPDGRPLFACSLERVTREKQDGRPPKELLEIIPWDRISCVAVSTDEKLEEPANSISAIHPAPFAVPRTDKLIHGPEFAAFLDTLPAPKRFVCHQASHAAVAFWLSGFDKALCFTYDGGMHNCAWFGGLFDASRDTRVIKPLDRFAATHYAKITTLYTAVTAILGFTPNKHEGKITGLAAFGKPTSRCRDILGDLFTNGYLELEESMEWLFLYSSQNVPFLMVHEERRRRLAEKLNGIPKEDLAATVQAMAEEHIVQILKNAAGQGWKYGSICLAGGLFSNVKINQRVREFGFENIFIAPPMTDDGTALGAALSVAVEGSASTPPAMTDMGLGFGFDTGNIEECLKARGVKYAKLDDPEEVLAQKLSEGKVVAVFQGKMEFGPRALGRRSILCQATDHKINAILNERLRRTEFMPFAPMTRAEDANDLYLNFHGAERAAGFMTITFNCTDLMKRQSPAVVHVDGTARPQIVRRETEPFIHRLLTLYKGKTGIASVVNTSFNIHEEPIVCSPDDAIDGFLSSGVDYLYMEGGYLADFSMNALAAISHITGRMKDERKKEKTLALINAELSRRCENTSAQLEEKEGFILTQESSLKEKDDLILGQESSLTSIAGRRLDSNAS
jgi:carbamoyltransferase